MTDKARIKHGVSTGVVVARLLLLFAAGAALVVSVVLSRGHDQAASRSTGRFVCPMHPQIVSAVPGDCPICNMALERAPEARETQTMTTTRGAFDEVKRRVVTQAVRAPAWLGPGGVVTAVMFKESLQGLTAGDEAQFFRGTQPARAISVRLTAEPPAPWDASTVQVRFASKEAPLSDRDTGCLQVDAKLRELLVVPMSSVLYSGDGAYVLAAPPGGHAFRRRSIQVGRILDSGSEAELAADRFGGVVVLSGLSEGERVVTADTFSLDAERRLQESQGRPEEVIE
jgi:hypothetical protein